MDFLVKYKSNKSIEKYKPGLVAKYIHKPIV